MRRRKASEDVSEHPCKPIREEISNVGVHNLTVRGVNRIQENVYKCCRGNRPRILKNIDESDDGEEMILINNRDHHINVHKKIVKFLRNNDTEVKVDVGSQEIGIQYIS